MPGDAPDPVTIESRRTEALDEPEVGKGTQQMVGDAPERCSGPSETGGVHLLLDPLANGLRLDDQPRGPQPTTDRFQRDVAEQRIGSSQHQSRSESPVFLGPCGHVGGTESLELRNVRRAEEVPELEALPSPHPRVRGGLVGGVLVEDEAPEVVSGGLQRRGVEHRLEFCKEGASAC
jgi:hypothetical protein